MTLTIPDNIQPKSVSSSKKQPISTKNKQVIHSSNPIIKKTGQEKK